MDIISQTSDSLSLDFVKEHLNVDFADDDVLIQAYIDASLNFIQTSIHRELLETVYENTINELIPIDSKYELRIKFRPEKVILENSIETLELYSDEFYFNTGIGKLYINEFEDAVKITAYTGQSGNDNPLVDQTRLMVIASWYSFRESDIVGNIKEIPMGVTRMLDILSNSSI